MTSATGYPSTDRPPRPRGAKVLLILGAVLLVLGMGAIFVGAAVLGDGASDLSVNGENARRQLDLEVPVPGRGEVQLRAGRYNIYAINPSGAFGGTVPSTYEETSTPELERPRVTVTSATGLAVPLDVAGLEWLFDSSTSLFVIDGFRITEPGTYTVVATGSGAERVGVGLASDNGKAIGKAVGGGLLTVGGFLVAGLGFFLALIGLIWFFVSGRPPTYVAPTAWTPPPSAWNQPPGAPPGWGNQPPGAPPGWGTQPPGPPGPPQPWSPPGAPAWAPPPPAPPPPPAGPPTDRGPAGTDEWPPRPSI